LVLLAGLIGAYHVGRRFIERKPEDHCPAELYRAPGSDGGHT
jgi:hypothetical protein